MEPEGTIADWMLSSAFYSVTKTDSELSIICEQAAAPQTVLAEGGWNLLGVNGPLEFSMIGVLARISSVLAEANVSILAVSTYDTDYFLVRSNQLSETCKALEAHGYRIRQSSMKML
jgi:hypothetical protein